MESRYRKWIDDNYPADMFVRGLCREACEKMHAEFPELRIACGVVFVPLFPAKDSEQEHWWLVDGNGDVVDPTRQQFPGFIQYNEAGADDPRRKYHRATCANCGERYLITPEWSDGTVCSQQCYTQYAAYLSNPI